MSEMPGVAGRLPTLRPRDGLPLELEVSVRASPRQVGQRPSPHVLESFTAPVSATRVVSAVAALAEDVAADGLFVGREGGLHGALTPVGEVPAITPELGSLSPGVQPNDELLIYINGILNTVAQQRTAMEAIANKTGSRVIGIHNATEGLRADLQQCASDKAGLDHLNPATLTASRAIYQSLRKGEPLHLLAHSQGALITSGALSLVKTQLVRDAESMGPEGERARLLLQRFQEIRVETFGGAASTYPVGPRYVHYINTLDCVSMEVGLGADDYWFQEAAGGPGSVVHFVSDYRGLNPMSAHDFMQDGEHPERGGYLAQRVPFEQARRGEFHDVDTHR